MVRVYARVVFSTPANPAYTFRSNCFVDVFLPEFPHISIAALFCFAFTLHPHNIKQGAWAKEFIA